MKSKTENEKLGLAVIRPTAARAGLYRCFADEFKKDGTPYLDWNKNPVLRCSVCSAAETNNARIVRAHFDQFHDQLLHLNLKFSTPSYEVTQSRTHKHKIVFYLPIEQLRTNDKRRA